MGSLGRQEHGPGEKRRLLPGILHCAFQVTTVEVERSTVAEAVVSRCRLWRDRSFTYMILLLVQGRRMGLRRLVQRRDGPGV